MRRVKHVPISSPHHIELGRESTYAESRPISPQWEGSSELLLALVISAIGWAWAFHRVTREPREAGPHVLGQQAGDQGMNTHDGSKRTDVYVGKLTMNLNLRFPKRK